MGVKRILIVDDEEAIRLLLEETLEEEGYETLVTDNAPKAIEVIERGLLEIRHIDLVILDIKMEGMSGSEALPIILGLDNNIRVILYTAYSAYQGLFMNWAAHAYIVKSCDLGELVGKVKKLLE